MTGRETPPDAVLHLLDEAGIAEDPALVRAVGTIGALGSGPAPAVTAELAQLMADGGKAPPARRNKRRITFIGGALAVSMGVGMSGVAAGTFHLTDGLTEAVESIARFTVRDSADRADPRPGAMAGPDDGGRGIVTPAEIPAPSHATAVPAPTPSVPEPPAEPVPSVAEPSRSSSSGAEDRAAGTRPPAAGAGPSAAPAARRPVHTAPSVPADAVQRADVPPAATPPATVPARQAPPAAGPAAVPPAAAPHAVPRAAASPVAPAGSAPAPGPERRSAAAPHSPAPGSPPPGSPATGSPAPGSHAPGSPVPGSGKAPGRAPGNGEAAAPAAGNGTANKPGHEVRQTRHSRQEPPGGLDAGSQGAGASSVEGASTVPGRGWLHAPAVGPEGVPSAPGNPDRSASAGLEADRQGRAAESAPGNPGRPAPAGLEADRRSPAAAPGSDLGPASAPEPAGGAAGASDLR